MDERERGRVAPDAAYVVARRALLDSLAALEDGAHRAFSIAVAGPAALVVAKTHKIAGRPR